MKSKLQAFRHNLRSAIEARSRRKAGLAALFLWYAAQARHDLAVMKGFPSSLPPYDMRDNRKTTESRFAKSLRRRAKVESSKARAELRKHGIQVPARSIRVVPLPDIDGVTTIPLADIFKPGGMERMESTIREAIYPQPDIIKRSALDAYNDMARGTRREVDGVPLDPRFHDISDELFRRLREDSRFVVNRGAACVFVMWHPKGAEPVAVAYSNLVNGHPRYRTRIHPDILKRWYTT